MGLLSKFFGRQKEDYEGWSRLPDSVDSSEEFGGEEELDIVTDEVIIHFTPSANYVYMNYTDRDTLDGDTPVLVLWDKNENEITISGNYVIVSLFDRNAHGEEEVLLSKSVARYHLAEFTIPMIKIEVNKGYKG